MGAFRRFAVLVFLVTNPPAFAADPLAGSALYADVQRYDGFGVHRYGSPGAEQAMAWIAGEFERAGLAVSSQRFTLARQYEFESGTLTVDGESRSVVPQWWIPEAQGSFSLAAPIAAPGDGPAAGSYVRADLAFDRGAYLNAQHRAAIEAALARRPAAVLLTIDHPSGEIFTYNVDQKEKPWPVPVILVAPKDEAKLAAAEARGEPVTVSIQGRLERNVVGRNIIGRLDRGKARTIVVSTPVSSWFTSSCERGPGIAAFLATAQAASQSMKDVNFVFVGTSGHEVGHGGMEHFIHDRAPKPQAELLDPVFEQIEASLLQFPQQ